MKIYYIILLAVLMSLSLDAQDGFYKSDLDSLIYKKTRFLFDRYEHLMRVMSDRNSDISQKRHTKEILEEVYFVKPYMNKTAKIYSDSENINKGEDISDFLDNLIKSSLKRTAISYDMKIVVPWKDRSSEYYEPKKDISSGHHNARGYLIMEQIKVDVDTTEGGKIIKRNPAFYKNDNLYFRMYFNIALKKDEDNNFILNDPGNSIHIHEIKILTEIPEEDENDVKIYKNKFLPTSKRITNLLPALSSIPKEIIESLPASMIDTLAFYKEKYAGVYHVERISEDVFDYSPPSFGSYFVPGLGFKSLKHKNPNKKNKSWYKILLCSGISYGLIGGATYYRIKTETPYFRDNYQPTTTLAESKDKFKKARVKHRIFGGMMLGGIGTMTTCDCIIAKRNRKMKQAKKRFIPPSDFKLSIPESTGFLEYMEESESQKIEYSLSPSVNNSDYSSTYNLGVSFKVKF